MYLRHLHILLLATILRCGLARDLFNKFIPGGRPLYQYHHPNMIDYGYVPLYIIKGPDPASDYMANHFKPRYMFKRVRNPFHRFRRQVNQDEYIRDLLNSFGGMEEVNSSETEEQTTPEDAEVTTRNPKSGFYYLLDWNSFLEVDDQNGRRVSLRVQPKFGDPKRFFSVTVP